MDDGMIKNNFRLWKWFLLISSIILAAFIVHNYLF